MEHTVFAAMFWVHVLSAGIAEGFLGRRKQHYDKHKSFFYIVECRLLKLLVKMSLVRTSCLSLSVLLWTYVLNQELSLCMKTFWFVETWCGFVELLYGKWNMERLSISVPLSKVLVSFIDLVVTVFILFSSPFFCTFLLFRTKSCFELKFLLRARAKFLAVRSAQHESSSFTRLLLMDEQCFHGRILTSPQGQGLELGGALQSADTRPWSKD